MLNREGSFSRKRCACSFPKIAPIAHAVHITMFKAARNADRVVWTTPRAPKFQCVANGSQMPPGRDRRVIAAGRVEQAPEIHQLLHFIPHWVLIPLVRVRTTARTWLDQAKPHLSRQNPRCAVGQSSCAATAQKSQSRARG